MSKRTIFIATISGLTFIGCLLLLAGCLYLINRADQELNERRKAVASEEVRRSSLTSLTRLIEESTEERAAITSYIIAEDEVIDFLGLLKALGEEQGVLLTTESLEVISDKTQFEKLSVTIRVEGLYDGVTHILKMLETLPVQSSLVQVSMKRIGDDGAWAGQFRLNITKQKTP